MNSEVEQLLPWYQRTVFPDGTAVGTWQTEEKCELLTGGMPLTGKTALDIGCMAGMATLWLERQGCLVDACDIDPTYERQFAVVKQAFAMQAKYLSCSVYGIREAYRRSFDVVLMMGVYYHLQHPLLALQRCWDATGEVLLLEGEVDPDGWDAPARATFYRGEFKGDATNWWIPSVRCVEEWCRCLSGVREVEIIYPMLEETRIGVRVWR